MKRKFTTLKLTVLLTLGMGGLVNAQNIVPTASILHENYSGKHLTKRAIKSITAYNQINSGTVNYVAGQVIVLQPGFHVGSSAHFVGKIADSDKKAALLPNSVAEPDAFDTGITISTYPNPFVDRTLIEYYLPEPSLVTLSIVNIEGVVVSKLLSSEQQSEGVHRFNYGEKNIMPGIYSCILTTSTGRKVHKVLKL